MSLSKNVAAYQVVQQVLDTALGHKEIRYETESPKAAMRFRAEAYYYRRLLSEKGDDRFATLLLRISGKYVIITHRTEVGRILTLDGQELSPAEPAPMTEYEKTLELEAKRFASSLGLDIDD